MKSREKQEILISIERALDEVRVMLSIHRGGIECVDYLEDDGCLIVRFQGMCAGCPMASMTLESLVADTVQTLVPEVKRIEAADPNA
ncbi:NifU family protein [Candidatus Uhrbacteria bacterium]|nr:NifU family protein [Candidatus Uhrbacteria bacterium]